MKTGMTIDPITFAVIKSGLDSIADDMAYTVVRIARSEIVKDVMDFSAALCAADGQMVAQAKTIAQHLGAIPEAMAAVLARFGDDLNDGDAVIMNDPYHGGMHLPDIFMFMPLFFEGQRRAFAVVICHHTDVGGRVPVVELRNISRVFPTEPPVVALQHVDLTVMPGDHLAVDAVGHRAGGLDAQGPGGGRRCSWAGAGSCWRWHPC